MHANNTDTYFPTNRDMSTKPAVLRAEPHATVGAGFDYHLVKPPEQEALDAILADLKRREAP